MQITAPFPNVLLLSTGLAGISNQTFNLLPVGLNLEQIKEQTHEMAELKENVQKYASLS